MWGHAVKHTSIQRFKEPDKGGRWLGGRMAVESDVARPDEGSRQELRNGVKSALAI